MARRRHSDGQPETLRPHCRHQRQFRRLVLLIMPFADITHLAIYGFDGAAQIQSDPFSEAIGQDLIQQERPTMTIILLIFHAAFAASVGTFLGAGNYSGLAGAILPGIIAGLLISVPFLKSQLWSASALFVVSAIIGSIVINYVSDSNNLKRFYREQGSLVISIGSYKLGKSIDN